MSNETYADKAYLKDVYLELPDYHFRHKPLNDDDDIFIGRKDNEKNFLNMLSDSKTPTGAYLVTGFRGMGKTSFVNKVIHKYKKIQIKKNIKVKEIKVSFGKTDIRHTEVIKQVIHSFKSSLGSKFEKRILQLESRKSFTFFLLAFLGYFLVSNLRRNNSDWLNKPKDLTIEVTYFFAISIIFSFIVNVFIRILNYFIFENSLYKKLESLHTRANSEMVTEQENRGGFGNLSINPLPKIIQKRQPLNIKEVENELINIINGIQGGTKITSFVTLLIHFREVLERLLFRQTKKEFIFIFDELDKVDAQIFYDDLQQSVNSRRKYENIKAPIDEVRDRKQMMLVILASLKYLITESKARFIFIAGREMYESYLADIADRQSSIGSVFHHVIYIDSFLNDQINDNIGLRQMTEEYLKKILLPTLIEPAKEIIRKYNEKLKNLIYPTIITLDLTTQAEKEYYKNLCINDSLFKAYRWLLDKSVKENGEKYTFEEKFKIITLLEQLVTYLTYRSNGSPKKLTRLIENLVVDQRALNSQTLSERKNNLNKSSKNYDKFKIIVSYKLKEKKRIWATTLKRLRSIKYNILNSYSREFKPSAIRNFLHFSYTSQYKLAFISYLYRPYIIAYGNKVSRSSDYLLVSTSYLVDHILKFHPFAFAKRNLDLLPEIISISSSPQLRILIEELLQFLSSSYLRNTETPLFKYKFYSKVSNEISYLSKIYEDESAAFNFTLDESYTIKLHIKNKILELREIHKGFSPSSSYDFIHSIAELNNLLGDARFFDQEYDDAITSYSDALQSLRSMKSEYCNKIEIALIIIELQLKLGLTYEKTNMNEYALAYYTEAMSVTKNVIDAYYSDTSKDEVAKISLKELFEIGSHAFIAVLFMQEKIGVEGVSIDNLYVISSGLNKLISKFENTESQKPISLIKALLNTNLATLFFYKNHSSIESRQVLWLNRYFKDPDLKKLITPANSETDFRFPYMGLLYNLKALGNLLQKFYPNLVIDEDFIQGKSASITHVYEYLKYSYEATKSPDFSTVIDKYYLQVFATALSRIGDSMICCIPGSNTDSMKVIVESLNIDLENDDIITKKFNKTFESLYQKTSDSELNPILFSILSFYLSYSYYLQSGKYRSANFQLRKIIQLFHFFIDSSLLNPVLLKNIETIFLSETLSLISNSANGTDRPQLLDLKNYFNISIIDTPKNLSKWFYSNISTSPDIKEAILLFAEIKIKLVNFSVELESNDSISNQDLLEEQCLVTPYNIYSSQWTRLMELVFQEKINRKIFKEYVSKKISQIVVTKCNEMLEKQGESVSSYSSVKDFLGEISKFGNLFNYWHFTLFDEFAKVEMSKLKNDKLNFNNSSKQINFLSCIEALKLIKEDSEIKAFIFQLNDLVNNSVYCLTHSIDIAQSYGNLYPVGNAYIGDMHRSLGRWMEWFQLTELLNLIFIEGINSLTSETNTKFKNTLVTLIGTHTLSNLDAISQYQNAKSYYHKTISMHQGGDIFKSYFREMNYFEDDFNDNLSHYAMAVERQRVNSGQIRSYITKLEKLLSKSQLFSYKSYVNTEK